ncbi:hypothetical protein M569_16539 [Genlisea aurea]|uniref:Uncharacterized protein n=1 Tax=Genlisea aurea TaxID=192259 RepID=S8DFX0_9LAMI|nr:hypothetical protein M569_16539 [Genlisea aurea]
MAESFTVHISSNLISHLLDDGERVKTRTRKPKPNIPSNPKQDGIDDSKKLQGGGWPLLQPPPPLYLPGIPPKQENNPDVDRIHSVLKESEKVLEKLEKKEESMLEDVTRRAKDLHDKEFKAPNPKPVPCLVEKNACLNCYEENLKEPLKCAQLVNDFAECARRARRSV